MDNAGNVLGYSSPEGMRAFRIQYKPKEGMWRANFQENMMVNNPYPNPGQHSFQLKNIHIDLLVDIFRCGRIIVKNFAAFGEN